MFELIEGLNHWQIYALVLWLLIQGTVFALVPEEVIILSLGVLWSQGKVEFIPALASVLFGLMCANSGMVYLASRFSHKPLFQKDSVRRALLVVRERGRWVIFLTRFTPFVRGPVYASVGLSGMGVSGFFKIDFAASLIQVPALMLIGAYIGERTGSIAAAYKIIGIGALSAAALTISVVLIRERLRRRTNLIKPETRV